ncbi:MAG: hypothetical protein AB7F99_11400 [Vicinamibacterales bacterium]
MAKRNSWTTRIAIGAVLLLVLGWLFMRSVRDVRSTPYTVRAADLQGWQVVTGGDSDAMVGLQPPSSLTADLFKQVFARNMESITSPASPQIPVILRIEAGGLNTQAAPIASIITEAGLGSSPLAPTCFGTRRTAPPASHDYYFIHFEAAPFVTARARLRDALQAQGADVSGFDPNDLQSTLVIATSDPAVRSTLPFEFDPSRDCVAPVSVE